MFLFSKWEVRSRREKQKLRQNKIEKEKKKIQTKLKIEMCFCLYIPPCIYSMRKMCSKVGISFVFEMEEKHKICGKSKQINKKK